MTPRDRYFGAETAALRRVLARLNEDQRRRYVDACKAAPRHRNGRLYDRERMRIAERILMEDHRAETRQGR